MINTEHPQNENIENTENNKINEEKTKINNNQKEEDQLVINISLKQKMLNIHQLL